MKPKAWKIQKEMVRAQLSRRGRVYNAGVVIEKSMYGMVCGRRNGEQNELRLASSFDHAKNGNPIPSTHRFSSSMHVKIALMR
jgi:hypothetical protein